MLSIDDADVLSNTVGALCAVKYLTIPNASQIEVYIKQALRECHEGSRIPYAVIDTDLDRVVGTTSFYNINNQTKKFYVGYTWYAEQYHKTHVNTCCKFLLLHHAFEELYLDALGFQTDILNLNSQRAIERLGASRDGVIRHDKLRSDRTVRDTVVYSIIKTEWPLIKEALQSKLNSFTLK